MEIRRFWVKNYKSLRDVALDFPTKLTVVAGPSGSGKTALAEAFLLLSDAAWGRSNRCTSTPSERRGGSSPSSTRAAAPPPGGSTTQYPY